jgi:hypothetical protein
MGAARREYLTFNQRVFVHHVLGGERRVVLDVGKNEPGSDLTREAGHF